MTTNEESAELWLDERPLGVVRAAPWRVTEGMHEVSLHLADGRSSGRSIDLAAGAREHFHVEFPEPPRSQACQVPPAPPLAPRPAKRADSFKVVPEASVRKTFAYGSAALSVGALAGAVTASLLRLDYAQRYNSDACAPNRSEKCAAYRDVAETLGSVAIAGYVIAGTAGLGSVALFTAPYWIPSRGPLGAQAGLSLSGSF